MFPEATALSKLIAFIIPGRFEIRRSFLLLGNASHRNQLKNYLHIKGETFTLVGIVESVE